MSNEDSMQRLRPKRKPPEPVRPVRGSAAYSRQAAPPSDNPVAAKVFETQLLGPRPARERDFRASFPRNWPTDKTGLEYFHRGLARRLSGGGGTAIAAASIRRDLEDGRICAVVIDDLIGRELPIPPERWKAAKTGAKMYWTGRATEFDGPVMRFEGDIYLTVEPEAAPEPETKPLDLSESEALCKLLLHLAGKKSAAQIANSSTGTEYAVSERTASRLLKQAREVIVEKNR